MDAGIASVILGASAIVGGAIWRLASEIGNLKIGIQNAVNGIAKQQAICDTKHAALDKGNAEQTIWARAIEAKIDGHLEAHAKGEC
jgi:hypothetical protein